MPGDASAVEDQRIVFDRLSEDGYSIYTIHADGSNEKRITAGRDARWSPDRKKIVFQARDGDATSIRTMNADGSDNVEITSGESMEVLPSWSPEGDQIVYVKCLPPGALWPRDSADVYVMKADGSAVRRLTRRADGWDGSPAWRPDGSRIAFVSDASGKSEIHVMSPDGTGERQLTTTPGAGGSGAHIDWSPDGGRIAFTSTRDGNVDIYVMDADGSHETRLTSDDSLVQACGRWSPNGERLVFHALPAGKGDEPPDLATAEIYVMNADGTNVVRLTSNEVMDAHPDW